MEKENEQPTNDQQNKPIDQKQLSENRERFLKDAIEELMKTEEDETIFLLVVKNTGKTLLVFSGNALKSLTEIDNARKNIPNFKTADTLLMLRRLQDITEILPK